jgi:hypothetical protein
MNLRQLTYAVYLRDGTKDSVALPMDGKPEILIYERNGRRIKAQLVRGQMGPGGAKGDPDGWWTQWYEEIAE